MKKKLLLLPIACLFLTGCEFLDFFKKQDNSQTPGNTDNTENTEESPGNPEEKPQETGNVKTFLTSGSDFFGEGTNFTTSSTAKNNELLAYINAQMSDSNPFTAISCDTLSGRPWDDINFLQFGSQNYDGILQLTSSKQISAIEVEVMCYVKHYNNTYNIENDSHFHIDDSDFDLSFDSHGGTTLPSLVKFTKTYTNPIQSFTFASSVHRVFLKSFKVTWAE